MLNSLIPTIEIQDYNNIYNTNMYKKTGFYHVICKTTNLIDETHANEDVEHHLVLIIKEADLSYCISSGTGRNTEQLEKIKLSLEKYITECNSRCTEKNKQTEDLTKRKTSLSEDFFLKTIAVSMKPELIEKVLEK